MILELIESPIVLALAVVAFTVVLLLLAPRKNKGIPTVSELNVYPIKSCAAISLQAAVATAQGFENDRILQVSDSKTGSYCTPRDRKYAKLFQVTPVFKNTNTLVLSAPDALSPLEFQLNDTTQSTICSPMVGPKVKLLDYGDSVSNWLERATGVKGCRLTGIGAAYKRFVEVNPDQGDVVPSTRLGKVAPVSLADEAPYLLTSTTSLAALNERLKARGQPPVDMQRFRPNLVMEGLKAWQEDSMSRIRVGQVEFHVWQRCGRCAMTTIDRDSLERGPEPLATLSTFRERAGQRNFGMHLVPVVPIHDRDDIIRVGDAIEILDYDDVRKAEWERLFG